MLSHWYSWTPDAPVEGGPLDQPATRCDPEVWRMLDDLDRSLLVALLERPRAGLREHARTLGVARGTVQARFVRLQEAGVITGFAPRVSPAALGYGVLAFVTLHIAQGRLDAVAEQLASVPEVVEAHSITGDGDLWCRVVAQSNAHLERVIQQLLASSGVERTQSEISLTERVPARVLPLVRALPRGGRRREES
jgi:DNA-binding Lrp family transcriptional regulator